MECHQSGDSLPVRSYSQTAYSYERSLIHYISIMHPALQRRSECTPLFHPHIRQPFLCRRLDFEYIHNGMMDILTYIYTLVKSFLLLISDDSAYKHRNQQITSGYSADSSCLQHLPHSNEDDNQEEFYLHHSIYRLFVSPLYYHLILTNHNQNLPASLWGDMLFPSISTFASEKHPHQ